MARKIIGSVWDREARNAINDNFEELYGYKNTADSAKEAADYAVNKADSVQEQFNQVVIEGDSSVEAAQARVDAEGKSYPTLKARLDAKETELRQKDEDLSTQLAQTSQDLVIVDNKATDALAKANNPLEALTTAGYKITLDDLSNGVKDAMTGTTGITTAKGYFENNRGVDYPLKNMTFRGNLGTITDLAKNAILDVKIFGAKVDCYYKLDMVSNGFLSNGKERWGITLTEYRKSDFESVGYRTSYEFIYNDDALVGNEGNANYVKVSDIIDTITVDNGEIAVSVTVDRSVLDAQGLTFINLNTTHAPTAIVDPSNYFF